MCMPVIYAFVMLTFFIPTDARSAAQRARQERERQARQANGSGSIPNARSLAQQARRQRERLEREQLMQEQRNLLHSFVNFVTQGYKGTVGSSREFRHLMTKEV